MKKVSSSKSVSFTLDEHLFKNFTYIIKNNDKDNNQKEVRCFYSMDDNDFILTIYYPNSLYQEDKGFVEETKIFIKALVNNHEIVRCSSTLLDSKSYTFETKTEHDATVTLELTKRKEDKSLGLIKWFKNTKRSTKAVLITSLSLLLAAAVAVPVYFTCFKEAVISNTIEDLITKDEEEKALILDAVSFSNVKVVLNKDFNTTISLKESYKPDFDLKNIKVYTYVNNAQTTKNYKALSKKELVKDRDYTINQERKTASLTVNSSSFNNKLEISMGVKEVTFNRIVSFEDKQLLYNEEGHPITIKLKEGRTLPENTSITYKCDKETKTGEEYFTFYDVGNYSLTVTLSAPEYETYQKTIAIKIDKKELSDEQKACIKFNDDSLKKKIGNITAPTVDNTTGIPIQSSTECEYLVNDVWTTTLPSETGTYKVKKTLSFKNYNDYTIEGDFIVDPYATIRVTFDVKSSGGSWGKDGNDSSITTDSIEMLPTGIKFGVFIENLKKQLGYKDPYKNGYSFDGQWYDSDSQLTADSTINYNESFTVKATFNINSYKLNLDPNGGTITTKTVNVQYNEPILEKVSTLAAPTHKSGLFKGWGETSDARNPIDSTLTMPAEDKTLYAIWYKYDFQFVNGEHGRAITQEGVNLNNLISLKSKPAGVTIVADAGYVFNYKYEVYFGDELYSDNFVFNNQDEIAPGKFNIKDNGDINVKITIKPIFDATGITAIFETDGGIVRKGQDVITTLSIKCGDKIIDHLTDLTVTKNNTIFKNKWLLNGEEITDQIMPATPITIRPVYHTYNIHIVGDEHVTIDDSSKIINDKIQLYSDEIKYTINDGYLLSKFQYSFDNKTFENISGMPFKPFLFEQDTSSLHQDVYLKIITEEKGELMDVILDAGEGVFVDGKDYLALKINKGSTFEHIIGTIGEPTKGGQMFSYWLDENGNKIDYETPITGVDKYYALAIYEEESNV